MAVPTTNFGIEDIADELFINASDVANTEDLFTYEYIIAEGLDPAYNPESTAAARLAALKTKPYEIGRWRNYEAPSPTEGTTSITNPFGTSRFVGLFIYVSPDGKHLFVFGYIPGTTNSYRLAQFYLPVPRNINTAVYLRYKSFLDASNYHSGYSWMDMQFSASGDRIMLLSGYQTTVTASSYIRTIPLDTDWDISSSGAPYETEMITSPGYKGARGFCFTESGDKCILLEEDQQPVHWGHVFKLSSNFVLPSGSDTSDFGNVIPDFTLSRFGFEISTANNKVYISLDLMGSYNTAVESMSMALTSSSVVFGSTISQVCYDNTLPYVRDTAFNSNVGFIFFLENNIDSNRPLFPRIVTRISPY